MIESIIHKVNDGRLQRRSVSSIIGIMMHRIGVDLRTGVIISYDAEEICHAFLGNIARWHEVAKVTGRQNPYTFYVGNKCDPHTDGKVWQALRLDEIGWHARKSSIQYIGIGCIGDFREEAPSPKQFNEAAVLAAELCMLLGRTEKSVVGHGEVTGAHGGEKAYGKYHACPGDLFEMDSFRGLVSSIIASKSLCDSTASGRLIERGAVLSSIS